MKAEQIEKLLTPEGAKTIGDMTNAIKVLGPADKSALFLHVVTLHGGTLDPNAIPDFKKMNVLINEVRLRWLALHKKMPDGTPVNEGGLRAQMADHVARIIAMANPAPTKPSETKEQPAREVPSKGNKPSETKEEPVRNVPSKGNKPSERKAAAPAKAKVKVIKNPDIEVVPTKIHRAREQKKAAKAAAVASKAAVKFAKVVSEKRLPREPRKVASVEKAPAKKAPVKGVPAKKVAVAKTPAKKAPVKGVPAKKVAPAKKAPVKAAPVKGVPAKKVAPAKKAPVKAAPVKKAAKKTTPAKRVYAPGERNGYAPKRRYGNGRADALDKLVVKFRGAYEPEQQQEIVETIVNKYGPWPTLQNKPNRTISAIRSQLFLSGQLLKADNRAHIGRPRA